MLEGDIMDASSEFKDSLPTTPEMLMAFLDKLEISYVIHRHPPLRTVEDSKLHRGKLTGIHIKNLYLRDRKKQSFLLVTEENQKIDLKNLNQKIGCDRLSFGSAERLFEMLGVRPGAVSPFTLINDPNQKVCLVMDTALQSNKRIYAHPLVNDVTLGIDGTSLQRFFTYIGHQVKWVDFS